MSGRFWAASVLCSVFALLHCGGSVVIAPESGGAAGLSGVAGRSGHAGSAGAAPGGSGGQSGDAGFDVYVDPGCPKLGPPVRSNECDVFALTPSCPVGQGCFPFVDHPFGAGCDAQTFGSRCRPAGLGRQGETCDAGDTSCAPGFACVVGAQPGKRCVQLCPINGPKVCAAGLICSELDVEGYGVCS